MNKLKTVNQSILKNNEFLGLHKEFITYAKGVESVTELSTSLSAYKTAMETLDKHLEVSVAESNASLASRMSGERITAYVNLRKFAEALAGLENADLATIGKTYVAILDGYGNPRELNQREASNVIDVVVKALRSRPKEELAQSGIENWLSQLESKQNAYLNANTSRNEERDARVDDATLHYRSACVAKYNVFVHHAYALAESNGDAACVSFIEQVNGGLALCKEKLKMRKTLAEKKKTTQTDTKVDEPATAKASEEGAAA